MSTKLRFEAPSDLSVGRVRVQNADNELVDWIATPSQKEKIFDDVTPGIYTAVIEPLGQPARPFVFKVEAGIANDIVTPALSVLAAQGSFGERFEVGAEGREPPTTELTRASHPEAVRPKGAEKAKAISIGLSREGRPGRTGTWRPYDRNPEPSVELTRGELHVLIDRTSAPLAGSKGQRLRLSASIEGTRVERMMVPLFAGGTRIIISASRLTTADLTFRVFPMDTERRALTQALQSGTSAEAAAVRDDVLRGGSISRFIRDDDVQDPWAAVTAVLLTIRFPELFGQKESGWAARLVKLYPWLPDVHILAARQTLVSAGQTDKARLAAARGALDSIHTARQLAAPYFAYSNQLMSELLGALAGARLQGLQADVEKEIASWQTDIPLQRSAGAIFSWLKSSSHEEKGFSIARPSGNLDEEDSQILFQGQVDLAQIGLTGASSAGDSGSQAQWRVAAGASGGSESKKAAKKKAAKKKAAKKKATASPIRPRAKSPSQHGETDPPALRRPVTKKDDPNKGRFGGVAEKDGYRLEAEFSGRGAWIGILLKVVADRSQHESSYSDVVEFYLHDSFNPPRLRASFQGYQARLQVYSYGGFTVGAWLPAKGIELELDLALIPKAPKAIREY